jgi:hypothetical protein
MKRLLNKYFFLFQTLLFSGTFLLILSAGLLISGCQPGENVHEFYGRFSKDNKRIWIGAPYWANPLQDWRLKNGRIECYRSGGNRSVFL